MSGTKTGGAKAAETNKKKHGKDFYARIGRMGGKNGHTGGFASEKVGDDGLTGYERAKVAGSKGGAISKRGPSKKGYSNTHRIIISAERLAIIRAELAEADNA